MVERIPKAFSFSWWEAGETIRKDSLLYYFLNTEGIQNFQGEVEVETVKGKNIKQAYSSAQENLASEPKTKQSWNLLLKKKKENIFSW